MPERERSRPKRNHRAKRLTDRRQRRPRCPGVGSACRTVWARSDDPARLGDQPRRHADHRQNCERHGQPDLHAITVTLLKRNVCAWLASPDFVIASRKPARSGSYSRDARSRVRSPPRRSHGLDNERIPSGTFHHCLIGLMPRRSLELGLHKWPILSQAVHPDERR